MDKTVDQKGAKQTKLDTFYKKIAQSTTDESIKPKGTGYSNTDGTTESRKIGIDDTKTTVQQEKEAQLQADTELNESETSKKLRLVDDQQEGATGTDREKLSSTGFRLVHKSGDLFSCDETQSLAHCVSRDLRMGKGIAVMFKKIFASVNELKAQGKGIGDVAVLKKGQRFVYYLITKEKYSGKPTYDTLRDSLLSMKQHILRNGVTDLSMPRIGCGLDLLQWPKVEEMLRDIFGDTDLEITIYTLGSVK